MKRQLATLATCAGLLAIVATPALAQRVDAGGVPYRAWDVSAGSGLQFLTSRDSVATDRGGWSTPSGLGNVSIARYWTSHLKTELGITTLSIREGFEDAPVALPSGQVAQTFNTLRSRQQQVVLSGVYQFFDNEFAHPYAAAGLRVGVLDIESRRSPYATIIQNGTYQSIQVPEHITNRTDVQVRPFLAFGSKAYFSERVFARPEFMVTVGHSGLSQVGLNLGFGIDF